ncbi:MAG: T9SS type A sorting domain-containing protein [Bacteroidia bacterium]
MNSHIKNPYFNRHKNRLFISESGDWGGAITVYSIDSSLKLQTHFNNQRSNDSLPIFFVSNDTNLYFHANYGVRVNGKDYNYIAEINFDSLKDLRFDTLVVKVFRDRNKNNQYDTGEVSTYSYVNDMITNELYVSDQKGFITIYQLQGETVKVKFKEEALKDTCYKTPYSGGISSNKLGANKTRDTIYMPLWKTKLDANLKLNAYGNYWARLDTNKNINFEIFNNGCGNISDSVTLKVELEPNSIYVNSIPTYTSKNGNTLEYRLKAKPFSPTRVMVFIRCASANFNVNQDIMHTASITTNVNEDVSDNFDTIRQKCSNSYDPNAKRSTPEGIITKDLRRVLYHIDFQNEGNDDAWKVTIVDTLNLKMPVYEFQMKGASHPYIVTHNGKVITWTFNNINLKPKSKDEEGSKGYLVFEAKVNGELRVGDSIRNRASIYFDYNSPIETNYAVIKREEEESVNPIQDQVRGLLIYPNPNTGKFRIQNLEDKDHSYKLYNSLGAQVLSIQLNSKEEIYVDLGSYAKGIYFIVNDENQTYKLIKL